MPRLMLSDEHGSKLREILLHKTIYNKRDLRITVEGMLYRMRTGCPWRDLPEAFGGWSKVYKRFNAWSTSGKWLKVFQTLVADPDMEWVFIDGSYAKAHQHSAGAAGGMDQAIGKSRAGNTSNIHLAVGACGPPVVFETTGGQINDLHTGACLDCQGSRCASDHCGQGLRVRPYGNRLNNKVPKP